MKCAAAKVVKRRLIKLQCFYKPKTSKNTWIEIFGNCKHRQSKIYIELLTNDESNFGNFFKPCDGTIIRCVCIIRQIQYVAHTISPELWTTSWVKHSEQIKTTLHRVRQTKLTQRKNMHKWRLTSAKCKHWFVSSSWQFYPVPMNVKYDGNCVNSVSVMFTGAPDLSTNHNTFNYLRDQSVLTQD